MTTKTSHTYFGSRFAFLLVLLTCLRIPVASGQYAVTTPKSPGVLPHDQPSLSPGEPIRLHPENPHYFLFRGKPTVLISTAEHFGAVVNLDFDYVPYLDELKAHGFNFTQVFSGIMVEEEKSNLLGYDNPLAPHAGRLVVPWARSSVPGYANGGNKFDLSKFDQSYFNRLNDFVSEAGKRGIVVGIQLFWSYYRDDVWDISPLNARNNINGIGKGDRNSPYSLNDPAVTEVQKAMVEKFVSDLSEYDNVYYEVADGPTLGSASEAWSDYMVTVIAQAEASHKSQHLIFESISGWKIRSENPLISVFNFPGPSPEKVALNSKLPKVTAFADITGLGIEDKAYRLAGWELLLAGSGAYLCRDYSFTPSHPAGAPVLPPGRYGGGSAALRNELTILGNFVHGIDFIKMAPDFSAVKTAPSDATVQALSDPGKAYAIYIGPKQPRMTYYSVRWTGQVAPRYSETYTFYTRADDGARLAVDGKLLIDNWTTHPVTEDSAQIVLKAGHRYTLKMEYFQANAGAEAMLLWSSPSQSKEVIPSEQLFRPDGSSTGLKGEYYRDLSLSQLDMTRYDKEINFNWNGISPFPVLNAQSNSPPKLALNLPSGFYRASWLETLTGRVFDEQEFNHVGGVKEIALPAYSEGIVLSVKSIQRSVRTVPEVKK